MLDKKEAYKKFIADFDKEAEAERKAIQLDICKRELDRARALVNRVLDDEYRPDADSDGEIRADLLDFVKENPGTTSTEVEALRQAGDNLVSVLRSVQARGHIYCDEAVDDWRKLDKGASNG